MAGIRFVSAEVVVTLNLEERAELLPCSDNSAIQLPQRD